MAEEVFIKKSILKDIADAIREKNGRNEKYMPYEFSSAISNFATGKISDLEAYIRKGEVVFSEYNGNCPWKLTDHGTLIIGDPEMTTYLSSEFLSSPWAAYNAWIKNIVFNGEVVVPSGMTNLFSGMTELWLIFNIGRLNISNVTSLTGWFKGCKNLNTLDLTPLNARKVRDMNWTFHNCSSLVEVKLPYILNECEMIGTFSEAGFVNFNFFGNKVLRCRNLTETFKNCPNLKKVNLSGIDISKTVYMEETFAYCPKLKEVIVEPIFAPNLVSMKKAFDHCFSLEVNPKNFFYMVPSLETLDYMFNCCYHLKSFKFDTPVFSIKSINSMFSDCYGLESIDFSNWINFFYTGEQKLHPDSPFHNCWGLKEVIIGSKTMLSVKGWQISHYDAYTPREYYQTEIGFRPEPTHYAIEARLPTDPSPIQGYKILGPPGYDLVNAVEAGLRIDWQKSYSMAITQKVFSLQFLTDVWIGYYSDMNPQYTPAINLPYFGFPQTYSTTYLSTLISKAAMETGISEEDAAAFLALLDVGTNEESPITESYLENVGWALPYYMVEKNSGRMTYQLMFKEAGHYVREDCVVRPQPFYEYPSMHSFLSQNFSYNFTDMEIEKIEWLTNVLEPLDNLLPATIGFNKDRFYFSPDDHYSVEPPFYNSLSYKYDKRTRTLTVATPEDQFYLPPDAAGIFSGMIHLKTFSFEKINTQYCASYALMFYGDSELTEITDFKINSDIAREELIPFQDICNEDILEDVNDYRKKAANHSEMTNPKMTMNLVTKEVNYFYGGTSEPGDSRYYEWSYIMGIDRMFEGCTNLKKITFSDVDWSKVKTIDKQKKTYKSTLRTAIQKYIPAANIIEINKSYEKKNGYEQLSTDEPWYRLPFGEDFPVILSKYDPIKSSTIPNYNIEVEGLIDGPGLYYRERAITPEIVFNTYGMEENIFYSGMSLRHMMENFLALKGVSIQDLNSVEFRTKCWSFHGTQYKIQIREKEFVGPYLYYNDETKKLLIQTKYSNFYIKNNAEYIFYDMWNLRRINGFEKIIWEDITNISHLFDGCLSLFTVNLSNFILNKITDTSYMFNDCSSLEFLDISRIDFSQVRDMEYMFNNCFNLIKLDWAEDINTEKVTDMSHLFCNCSKLNLINLVQFDTDKVEDMSYMFYNCSALTSLYLKNFKTLKVENMSYMFAGCENLQEIDISNIIFPRKKDCIFMGTPEILSDQITSQFNSENIYFNNLFEECSYSKIDVSHFNWWMARDIKKMFKGCTNVTSLTLGKLESPWLYSMSQMFKNCESLETISFDSWITNTVTDIEELFYNCKSLINLDFKKINFHGRLIKASRMFMNCESLTELDFSNCYLYCNFDKIFYNCKSLVTISNLKGKYVKPLGLSFYWRKPDVTGRFFYNCESLKNISFKDMNFSKVNDYSYMFYNCKELEQIDLTFSFYFQGKNFSSTFEGCTKLKTIILPEKIDLTRFKFYEVDTLRRDHYLDYKTNFTKTFKNCINLEKIIGLQQIVNWIPCRRNEPDPEIWILEETFCNCKKLTSLNFDNIISSASQEEASSSDYITAGYFDTFIQNFYKTFYNCESLESIIFPHKREIYFKGTNIDMHETFCGCKDLQFLSLNNLHFNTKDKGLNFNPKEDTSTTFTYNFNKTFKDCKKITTLDFSSWWFDTWGQINNQNGNLYNTKNNLLLTDLNIGDFESMFENCEELEQIIFPDAIIDSVQTISSFTTVSGIFPFWYIKNADKMFKNCYNLINLQQLNFPRIVLNTVVTANQMFYGCVSLETNPIELWSNNLISIDEIFYGCTGFQHLDLTKWRTYFNKTSKNQAITGCTNLEELNIGSFYDNQEIEVTLNISDQGEYSFTADWSSVDDEYILCPAQPGYEGCPQHRPYIGFSIKEWNKMILKCRELEAKYIFASIGAKVKNLNQISSAEPSLGNIFFFKDLPLYYSGEDYSLGWKGPSTGAYEYIQNSSYWSKAFYKNINANYFIIKDFLVKTANNDFSYKNANMIKIQPIQSYCLLDVEKLQLIYSQDYLSQIENNYYWMTFPKTLYTGTQNNYTAWNGNIPTVLQTYYEYDLLPGKINTRLLNGENFNCEIKKLANYQQIENSSFKDSNIKKIIFENNSDREGKIIGLNGAPVYLSWDEELKTIYISMELDTTFILNTDCSSMFKNLTALQEIIGLDLLDITEVANMSGMFEGSGTATLNLDLTSWNTRILSNMKFMFKNCKANLINISNWKVENVVSDEQNNLTTSETIFESCIVNTLLANNLNWNNLTSMSCLFYKSNIQNLSVNNWTLPEVKSFYCLFAQAQILNYLDLSTWIFSKVQNCSNTFQSCSCKQVFINTWNVTSVTNMESMFDSFSITDTQNTQLAFTTWNVSNVTNMSRMFYGTKSGISKLIFNNFNPINVINFQQCFGTTGHSNQSDSLCQEIEIQSTWTITANCNVSGMFLYEAAQITGINNFNVSQATSLERMFYRYFGEELIFSWNTGNVTNMSYMFSNCQNLKILKINFVTDSPTQERINFSRMFEYCISLEQFETNSFLLTGLVSSMFYRVSYPLNLNHWRIGYNFSNFSLMFNNYLGTELVINNWVLAADQKVSLEGMFQNCCNLLTIDISCFDTRNITSWQGTFGNCTSLQNIIFKDNTFYLLESQSFKGPNDYGINYWPFENCTLDLQLNHWINIDRITFSNIFNGYKGTSLDFSSWANWGAIGSQIQNVASMCRDCTNLTTINLSGLQSWNISDFSHTFHNCTSLINIDFSYLTGINVKDCSYMFCNCSSLQGLDFSNFYPTFLQRCDYMFKGCSSLQNLDLTNFYLKNCIDFKQMFTDCSSLRTLIISNFHTSNVLATSRSFEGLFKNCSSLIELTLPTTFIVKTNSNKILDVKEMFYNCSSLQQLTIPSTFEAHFSQDASGMFYNCSSLTTLTLPNDFLLPDDFDYDITNGCKNFKQMFAECTSLRTLNQNLHLWSATNTEQMFYNCKNLQALDTHQDAGGFSFKSLQSCTEMFSHCESLVELDLRYCILSAIQGNSSITGKGTLTGMFSYCKKLTNLNITETFFSHGISNTLLDTTTVVPIITNNFNSVFEGCEKLIFLDLSYLTLQNSSEIIIENLFKGCESLVKVDLSNALFIGLKKMTSWFEGCSSLTTISWEKANNQDSLYNKFSTITSMEKMFKGCSSLIKCGKQISSDPAEAINLNVDFTNWTLSSLTNISGMFEDCINLEEIDWSYLPTTQLTTATNAFCNCSSLLVATFSLDNIWYIQNFSNMFKGCSELIYLNIPGIIINTDSVSVDSIFENCSKLTIIEFEKVKQTKALHENYLNKESCFKNCSSLETIYFSSCINNNWTSNNFIRRICEGERVNTPYVKILIEGIQVFNSITGDFEGWAGGIGTNYSNLFYNGKIIKEIDCSKLDISPSTLKLAFSKTSITNLANILINCTNTTDFTSFCAECQNLTILDTSNWKIVKSSCNFTKAFSGIPAIEIDGTNLNWENISTLSNIFENCINLVSIKISKIKSESVSTTRNIFYNCPNLKNLIFINCVNTEGIAKTCHYLVFAANQGSLNNNNTFKITINNFTGSSFKISNQTNLSAQDIWKRITEIEFINTSFANVTDLSYAFRDLGISSLDLSSFDLSKVATADCLFYNCTELMSIIFGQQSTPLLTNLRYAFYNCTSLINLDLSQWECLNISNLAKTFANCSNLESLNISGWASAAPLSSTSETLFDNDSSLISIFAVGFNTISFAANRSFLSSLTSLVNLYIPLSLASWYENANSWKYIAGKIKNGSTNELASIEIISDSFFYHNNNIQNFETYPVSMNLEVQYYDSNNTINVKESQRNHNWQILSGDAVINNDVLTPLSLDDGDIISIKAYNSENPEIYFVKNIRIISYNGSYNIDLNAEDGYYAWEQNNNIYRSTNYHVNSSTALCKINLQNYPVFSLEYYSNGQTNYDYMLIKLNSIPTDNNYDFSTKGDSSTTYKTALFDNLLPSNNIIYIIYKKNATTHSNDDRGYFRIPEQ